MAGGVWERKPPHRSMQSGIVRENEASGGGCVRAARVAHVGSKKESWAMAVLELGLTARRGRGKARWAARGSRGPAAAATLGRGEGWEEAGGLFLYGPRGGKGASWARRVLKPVRA